MMKTIEVYSVCLVKFCGNPPEACFPEHVSQQDFMFCLHA